MNIICFRYEPKDKNLNKYNQININLQKYLLKKHDIFFSIIQYKGVNWLRVVLLNPFFNMRHIKKICLSISEFTKDTKTLKTIKLNDYIYINFIIIFFNNFLTI